MIRLLLAAALAAGSVLIVGYLLFRIAAAVQGALRKPADVAGAEQSKRIGYTYIFFCWLICSAVLTALIWEYWF